MNGRDKAQGRPSLGFRGINDAARELAAGTEFAAQFLQ